MTTSPPQLRYAVLRHEGVEQPHFDLLFETAPGSMLQTWRLPTWPVTQVEEATRIRDHRPAFLTYQGQLTGDRGSVLRVDEGTCTVEQSPAHVIVRLAPRGVVLRFDRDASDPDAWHVRGESSLA